MNNTTNQSIKIIIDIALALMSVVVVLVLIELFSPAAKVFFSDDYNFENSNYPVFYTEEELANQNENIQERIDSVRRGEVEADLKRLRLEGPLYWICITLFLFYYLSYSDKAFIASFLVFSLPFVFFGFILISELLCCFFVLVISIIFLKKNSLLNFYK